MADEDIVGFTERFSTLIKTSGGEIIKIEDWGSKKLAYLVKKRDKGRYILFDFVGIPALIAEMERQYKISEDVIKFLSVKLDEDVDLEAFKAAQEKPAEPEPAEAAASVPPAEAQPDTTETAVTETQEPEAASETAAVEQEASPEAPSPAEPSPEQEPAPVAESTEGGPAQAPVEASSAEPVATEGPTPSEPVSDDKKEGL